MHFNVKFDKSWVPMNKGKMHIYTKQIASRYRNHELSHFLISLNGYKSILNFMAKNIPLLLSMNIFLVLKVQ